jgi:hypothetical protein
VHYILKILILVAAGFGLAPSLRAVPITGSITFGGTVNLDGTTVSDSSHANGWGAVNSVSAASGSFAGLNGALVNLSAPWSFNSGICNDLWNVGGFQFNQWTSVAFDNYNGVLTIIIMGNVTGNSYDLTSFSGRVKIQDPSVPNGAFHYTESLDFVTTPDGGTTVLLLGAALASLAVFRRKVPAV